MAYYYDENFMLPLSHDEVVHGKSPMIYKMPGNEWEKFANLRMLYTYMYTHPGGKLLFMGNEFGQTTEWNFETELDWRLLQYPVHLGMQECVKQLNNLYTSHPALYELQFDPSGFEWVDLNHRDECVMIFKRKGKSKKSRMIVILNMTPVARKNWKFVTKGKEEWHIIFNSDEKKFGGAGKFEGQEITTESVDKKDKQVEIKLHLPPLSALVLQ